MPILSAWWVISDFDTCGEQVMILLSGASAQETYHYSSQCWSLPYLLSAISYCCGGKTQKCCRGVGEFLSFFLFPSSLCLFCSGKGEHLCVFKQNCLSYKEMKMREGRNLTSIHWKQLFKPTKHIRNVPRSVEINRRWCYCDVCVCICPSYLSKIGTTRFC